MDCKSSSQTISKKLNLASESINDLIECPICYEPMMEKILCCFNGHSICGGCFDRLGLVKRCPTCKARYSCCNGKVTRNWTLENLILNTMLPCKYSHHGCKKYTMGTQRAYHLVNCEYQPLSCPFSCAILPLFPKCLYSTSSIEELSKHVVQQHGFDVFENKTSEFQFQLDDITDGSGHYRIILKSIEPKICCLLVGFKSPNGSIALFCRSLTNKYRRCNYKIIASFVSKDHKKHSVQWESQMYGVDEEIGLEFRRGLLLKLSKEQVKLWRENSQLSSQLNNVPLTVIVRDT